MSRQTPSRRSARRLSLVAFALVLIAPLLSIGPAAGHTATRNDGNDSPGRLDIRSASVGHVTNRVVHTVRTYDRWTPRSLSNDSFFIIEIDKNFDNDFERCAFIFFSGGRLRGSLTNCGRSFIRRLPVSKPSATVARITIPTADTGRAYRWVAFSYWTGLPARCSDLCFDAVPNRPPPILHDLTPPAINLEDGWLRVWEESTTGDFTYSFAVNDVHTSVSSWKLQRRVKGGTTWTEVAAGTGEGDQDIPIVGEPGRWTYRVVATDSQANTRIITGLVDVPIDDADLDPAAFTGTPTSVPDVDAFGGSYTELDPGESFSYTPSALTPCEFTMVGPSGAGWHIDVYIDGVFFTSKNWIDMPSGDRAIKLNILCTPSEEISVIVSDAVFGIDAILP